jgi:hypothetical protein
MDSLPKDIFRFLISSTSRFTGTYESEDIRIDHAWPTSYIRHGHGIDEGPYSRNYFVLSLRIEEREKTIMVPDYSHWGDLVCATLSILFGKRFDNHGFLASHGMFYRPDLSSGPPISYFSAAPYSHTTRKDLGIPLELARFASLAPLFTEEHPDEKFQAIFFAAGRFYLRSLQVFDQEPEFAYLDLITCGEIISSFYSYPLDELLDDETKRTLDAIRESTPDGYRLVRQLQGKFRQIKRSYTRTLLNLLTCARGVDFFSGSECTVEFGKLKREDIEKRLEASYDLRSKYVHTGVNFGKVTQPHGSIMNEVQLGSYTTVDKDLAKALTLAPTYFGMERIMRFCLLRFIHLHGVPIDSALDD